MDLKKIVEKRMTDLGTVKADVIYSETPEFWEMGFENFIPEVMNHFLLIANPMNNATNFELVKFEEADPRYETFPEDGLVKISTMQEYRQYCYDFCAGTLTPVKAVKAFEEEVSMGFLDIQDQWFTVVHGRLFIESDPNERN
jgi:hypothetical protein